MDLVKLNLAPYRGRTETRRVGFRKLRVQRNKMRRPRAQHELPDEHEISPKYRIHSPHLGTPDTAILAPEPMSCRGFHASLPLLGG